MIRGARIAEAGHGGQVLLSKTTAALIEDALIDGLSLRDLGAHRLKDLPGPERIFQLLIPDLPDDVPPIRSLDTRGRGHSAGTAGRVLTTVLVDMVGASSRLVAWGDRRWRELLAQCTALVRRQLARHHGEEMSIVGDQIVAVFDSAATAIHCACAIRDAVPALDIGVTVGIHAGEVEYDDRNVSGITVFTAVHITAAARPGEVLVSSLVKDLADGDRRHRRPARVGVAAPCGAARGATGGGSTIWRV